MGGEVTVASGTQDVVTETASLASPSTFESTTRAHAENTCQIVQKYVRTSYKAQSSFNKIIGDSSDYGSYDGPNAVTDIHAFQTDIVLAEFYRDFNYTCWNGVYVKSTGAGVAAATRGLNAAISTYETSTTGGVAELLKSDIDEHLATFADAGGDTDGLVIWVNSAAKIKLSNLYTLNSQLAPRDRNIGGVDVQSIITDFGTFPIVYDRDVPAGKIFFIKQDAVVNVWCPVPGKGNLFYEDKADAAAGITGMIYGQWGIDYGHEQLHSVIKTTDAS
jgi:hypothetical protein